MPRCSSWKDGWFDDFQPASSKEQTCGKDPGFGQQGRGSAEENLHPNKWKQSSLGPAAQTKQAPILQGQSQCVSQECGTSSSSIDPLLKLLNSSQYRLGSGKHQGGYADSPNGKRLQTRTDFKGALSPGHQCHFPVMWSPFLFQRDRSF
eukprot:jgi/Botrbrau1/12497/Bobra.0169s0044.1